MQMEACLFRSITSSIKSLIRKSFPLNSAQETVRDADLSGDTRVVSNAVRSQTQVVDAGLGTQVADEGTQASSIAAADQKKIDHASVKRFRRTKEEIRLGLSTEQAQAMRSPTKKNGKSPKHGKRGKDKAKRFKRTQQEIEAGLSIGQAEALRGTALPKASKKHAFVERKAAPAKPTDLIETLPPKIQARARAVSRYRSSGGKGVIPSDLFDKIEKAVAAGKVTHCPPCTDSDGYNHLTQQEAK
jgi:hypothetical protein